MELGASSPHAEGAKLWLFRPIPRPEKFLPSRTNLFSMRRHHAFIEAAEWALELGSKRSVIPIQMAARARDILHLVDHERVTP